jgi:hypothetical protein
MKKEDDLNKQQNRIRELQLNFDLKTKGVATSSGIVSSEDPSSDIFGGSKDFGGINFKDSSDTNTITESGTEADIDFRRETDPVKRG